MPERRAIRPATVVIAAACAFAAAACSTVPEVGGRSLADFPPEEQLRLASEAFAVGRHADAVSYVEYLLQHEFRFDGMERARFLAAEACFAAGDVRGALGHDRRLMEEFPLTGFAKQVERRAFAIGKESVEKPRGSVLGGPIAGGWLLDHDRVHDVGVEALTFLVTTFPRGDLADDGWKELAETIEEQGDLQAAADCFERLAREFPASEWVDLALYRVCACYRGLSRGGGFDADPLLLSWGALGRYLERFPDGNFVASAHEDRAALEEALGRRELEVAGYYAARGAAEGERLHLANAAARFPETQAAADARARLAAQGWTADASSADLLAPRTDRPTWRRDAPSAAP